MKKTGYIIFVMLLLSNTTQNMDNSPQDIILEKDIKTSSKAIARFNRAIYGPRDIKIYEQLQLEEYVSWKFLEKNLAGVSKFVPSDIPAKVKDLELKTYVYGSKEYVNSILYNYLSRRPTVFVYFLVTLEKNYGDEKLNLSQLGFEIQGNLDSLLGSDQIIVYSRYRHVSRLEKHLGIKSIEIIDKLKAVGYYSLVIYPQESRREVTMEFALPMSKPGNKMIRRNIEFPGLNDRDVHSKGQIEENRYRLIVDLHKEVPFAFLSKVTYLLDLEELLENDVYIATGGIRLKNYIEKTINLPEYARFVRFSEKVDRFPYLDTFAKYIKDRDSIASIWSKITKILNDTIIYDHQKRDDFFSGNIVYSNIRDMYLTASELINERVGACPERSSLEAAMLREVGVVSRLVTRLYHIYVEIYIPSRGWISTSSLIREIPLVISNNEEQSYFIDWDKDVPIRVMWRGSLIPISAL